MYFFILGKAVIYFIFLGISNILHLFLTPFSYANASDVFSTGEVEWKAFVVGTIVLLGAVIGAFIVYEKKDLAV